MILEAAEILLGFVGFDRVLTAILRRKEGKVVRRIKRTE